MNNSSNSADNGCSDGISFGADTRLYRSLPNAQVRAASRQKALRPAASRLLYPQGRTSSPRKRRAAPEHLPLRVALRSVRKESVRRIWRFSIPAVYVLGYAISLALDSLGKVQQSRRSVVDPPRRSAPLEREPSLLGVDRFWSGVARLKR